jgi:hypothetical protein
MSNETPSLASKHSGDDGRHCRCECGCTRYSGPQLYCTACRAGDHLPQNKVSHE